MPWVGILWNDCGVNWHYTDFGCKQGKLLLPFKAQIPDEYHILSFQRYIMFLVLPHGVMKRVWEGGG